jgi:twinkle protein
LFGMDKFSAGSSKYITVTEGEYDAASVFQMMGSKFPSVSVKSAATALGNCREAREYLNSFERIYLCFDNDGPGQEAAKNVASLFDINKIYHVILTKYKDANDYLVKGEAEEFSRIWWNSKRITPKGIVSGYDDIFKILKDKAKETVATYPFTTLSDMTYGIRLGEFILFKAQEKIGKTEVFRAIEHHLLKTTDYNIGIIHLEENERRTVDGLLSYETGIPCHVPDCPVSPEEKLEAYKKMTKTEDRLSYYAHFGSDDPDTILDVIRYLVAGCGCKFVFLDHITMLVTGFEGDDERKKLDYLSTRLAMLTRELNFTLFAISHVNDTGQTRGSRNIGKVADLIVSLDRDIKAADPKVRNTTKLLVEGNRFFAPSGPAGMLEFDVASYTLKEVKIEKDMGAFNF